MKLIGGIAVVLQSDNTSRPAAINDNDLVVGYSAFIGGVSFGQPTAMEWRNGIGTKLDEMPSAASAVNSRGDVTGFSNGSNVIWKIGSSGSFALMRLHVFKAGNSEGTSGINNCDVVVGQSSNIAIVWTNHKVYDLNKLTLNRPGFTMNNAVGINNRGEIVGSGTSLRTGLTHGFLLTPICPPKHSGCANGVEKMN